MENTDPEIVTDGGSKDDDVEWIDSEEIVELALEYRDKMLKSLGVIGIENSASYSAPGEQVRRYPVETAGSHTGNTVGTHRVLTDVRNYDDPDHAVASDNQVKYMTVRETTGYAAIQSSATTALGWSTIPTPREVRLSEYLENLDKSDVKPHHPRISRTRAAEEIVEQVFPDNSKYDKYDLWLKPEETSIVNTIAIEECVAALRFNEDEKRNHIIRFCGDYDDANTDAPLDYRLSTPRGIIIEKYFDNPSDELGSESWHRVYLGLEANEVDADVDAMGYVSIDADDAGGESVETDVVTIPEMQRPEDILDLPSPEPRKPSGKNRSQGS